ncbi:hypothetical protein EW026_g3676 [Hermanssonia centrifuga]|uniref:Alpha/beta hydrolase fold-3 domain-containing protein n=1 Tax=Hermanssonia centrifuga TaxID=98765 RepID=A0A4V3XAL0_9APHY|nr:hypothetical protein EW026_g3676 [Hermanssonia centrifuga]
MPAPALLAWQAQPFKAFYITYIFTTLITIRLPVWSIACLLPALRPRSSWSYSRSLWVKLYSVFFKVIFNTGSCKFLRIDPKTFIKDAEEHGLVWIDATPELVVGEIQEYAKRNGVAAAQVAGYWFGKRDEKTGLAGQRAGPDEKVMLQFHCGGWVEQLGDGSPKSIDARMCNDILKRFPQFSRLLSLEYRLSQGHTLPIENPFPAGLIDATAAYNYLVNDLGFKPSNILVMGDSAGGGLVISLARYLKIAAFPSLPLPGGLFLMSPTADWSTSHHGPGTSHDINSKSDWVQGFTAGYCGRALIGHLPESEIDTNAWISPSSLRLPKAEGWFEGFPSTLVHAGGAEMTLDQMRTLTDRMRGDMERIRLLMLKRRMGRISC